MSGPAITFRPAVRENTPLIIGLAGPTKSGKTFSAHRLAVGLAGGGVVAMINAEGPRGHQYADTFKYVAADLDAPYRPERYTEAVEAAKTLNPAVLIIDSVSHMHDGPGGVLEYHEDELDRMAGKDFKARDRVNFAAWVKPKAAENAFIYALLGLSCPTILCMRAKEKLKIVPGKPPVDLGWQPIVGERVAFETIFTLLLPPHSRGVPDQGQSQMREPFDAIVPFNKPIDELLGQRLAEWSKGTRRDAPTPAPSSAAPAAPRGADPQPSSEELFDRMMDDSVQDPREALLELIEAEKAKLEKKPTTAQWAIIHRAKTGVAELAVADVATLDDLFTFIRRLAEKNPEALAEARQLVAGKSA